MTGYDPKAETSNRLIGEFQADRHRILFFEMLVVIRHLGGHRRDVATDKAQDIDFMNQVGQDRTSLAVTTPGRA